MLRLSFPPDVCSIRGVSGWIQIGESHDPVERHVDLLIDSCSWTSNPRRLPSITGNDSAVPCSAPSSPLHASNNSLNTTNDPLELLHLSDFHFRPGWSSAYDRQLARFASTRPSLILVTGDFIDNKFDPRPALPVLRRYVEHLRMIAPVVACLGNHDGDLLAPHLIDYGARVLLNEVHRCKFHGVPFEIIGAAGVARRDLDLHALKTQLLQNERQGEQGVRIGLSHYPDAIHALATLKPHVVLAGHTHGGQVCLPGGRPIITHDSLPKQYTTGLTTPDGVTLTISRGLGMSTYPIRLFCPSEYTRLSIRIHAGASF